ncbi:MAG: hypothetical protein AAGI68_11815 [Planctomycetota bacterium]
MGTAKITDGDWSRVWGLMGQLWPESVAKQTGEQQAAYRRVMSGMREDQAVYVLRALAETSRYLPKPAEVRAAEGRARERKRGREPAVMSEAVLRDRGERERLAAERAGWLERVAGLEASEREAAVERVVSCRGFGWMRGRDVLKSPGLAVLVLRELGMLVGEGVGDG